MQPEVIRFKQSNPRGRRATRCCVVCHDYAPEWAIEVTSSCLKLDHTGSITHSMEVKHYFYCDEHVPYEPPPLFAKKRR